jgi:hypothetical protein
MTSHSGRPIARLALAVAFFGVAQVVLLEYDTNVPQFSEALYLPVLVVVGLGSAWLIRHAVGTRFAVSWTLAVYLVFRLAVFAVLAAIGWPRPDLPLALLGLVVVDLVPRWGRLCWPLAGLAVTGLQVLASATGVSSLSLRPVGASAVAVGSVLAVAAMALFMRRRTLLVLAAVGLVAVAPLVGAAPARAHNPGKGSEIGSARVVVSGDGSGDLAVKVVDIQGVADGALRPESLVARRAGRKVTGAVRSGPPSQGRPAYVGSITLPSPGLWFVYVEMCERSRPLEIWRAVEYGVAGASAERRSIYVSSGAQPRPTTEYVAGIMLYAISVVLLIWAIGFVRRSGTDGDEGATTVG